MGADVSVLIVSYNTGALLVRCLESLATSAAGVATEVIVVDNASTDDSVASVKGGFPDVQVVEAGVNQGFARAVNAAAARATGEYLLLLNPDTVVFDGAVHNLLAFARANPAYGVYGGRTERADGTLEPSSCWGQPTLWSHVCFGLGLTTAFRRSRLFDPESLGTWRRDTVRTVGVVTGCLLMLRRETFEQLGGFDARYFMYGEDVDLCMRARGQGWDPVITPDATVVHHVGAASSNWANKFVLVLTGKVTLATTHWTGWRRRLCLSMIDLGVALRAVLDVLSKAVRPGRPRRSDWPALWRRRGEWRSGYPAVDAAGLAPERP
ncbi:glycosyl transferase [Pseudofrankia sp. BMG5.36]|nr:glycosyl transferase [Pseudofrankia sp. BMG5.36]